MEVGRGMAGRLLAHYGVNDDEQLLGYVNQVGAYVSGFSDVPDRRYMFEILDSDSVNAFAAPGGYILVTRGALRHATSEAELAHVLGHEVAHVGMKHMFDALKNMSEEELEKTAKEGEEAATKLPPTMKARKRPQVTENETASMMARYIGGSAAGLNMLQAARAGMSLIMEKGLGAEKEFEADVAGTRYAVRAGYQPNALMNYLCRIEQKKQKKKGRCRLKKSRKKSGKKKASVMDRTHPSIVDRVANIKRALHGMGGERIVGASGIERYRRYTVGLRK